jgi:hypothetical protein
MKFRLFLSLLISMPLALMAQVATPVVVTPPTPVPTPTVDTKTAPKLTCSKPNFDFGNVDEGPDIVHEFHCKNSGHGKLIVNNVSTSCGCTAAVAQKKGTKEGSAASYPVTFAPGETVIIKATYHTSGRPGHATKVITVASNDPANMNFQLKLDMTVVREVDVQPDRLYLYGVKKGEKRTSTVKILGKPDHPLHILSAVVKSGMVTITSMTPFEDKNEHRSGATLEVDLTAGLTIGSFTDEIQVKTDNAKKPDLTVAVLGEVRGNVQYNPKSLFFSPHQDIPVTITFQSDTPKNFQIRNVSSAKFLTKPHVVKTTGSDGVDQFSVVVSCVRDLPKDSDGKDQVLVTTNDPEMTHISIEAQLNK